MTIHIRKATAADVRDIVRLRRGMFEAMDETIDASKLDAMVQACTQYFPDILDAGCMHAWLAVTESQWPIGSGALIVDQRPPGPENLSGKEAYIFNLYTEPDYRQQGVAQKIMHAMLRWINHQGITAATLVASEEAMPLYEMLGFKPIRAMRLSLTHERIWEK